jgi:hypothetical protein
MHYKDLENNLYFLDSTEFEHFLPVGCVQITDNETDSIRNTAEQGRLNAMTFTENRQAAYPSIADQLDALWKGGAAAEEMKATVMAIKEKYPK